MSDVERYTDCFGASIRVTRERMNHVLEHPEMRSLEQEIAATLANPESVRQSRSDDTIHLFYRYLNETLVGSKWLCLVVKCQLPDPFLITAYLTDKQKTVELLWPNT